MKPQKITDRCKQLALTDTLVIAAAWDHTIRRVRDKAAYALDPSAPEDVQFLEGIGVSHAREDKNMVTIHAFFELEDAP